MATRVQDKKLNYEPARSLVMMVVFYSDLNCTTFLFVQVSFTADALKLNILDLARSGSPLILRYPSPLYCTVL